MTLQIRVDQAKNLPPERRSAIEAFYGALKDGTFDRLDVALAPDWADIPLAPGQEAGPAGIKPVYDLLRTAFPDIDVEIVDVLADGDKAACHVLVKGTQREALFGVPASDRPVQLVLHEFHDFVGSRIQRTYHLEDLFGLFGQIGQFPDTAAEAA